MSDKPEVMVIIGPELGDALGRTIGPILADSLGLAMADAVLQLERGRDHSWSVADLQALVMEVGALRTALEKQVSANDVNARQTQAVFQKTLELIRQREIPSNRVADGWAGAASTDLQPSSFDWQRPEPSLFSELSSIGSAIAATISRAYQFDGRVQELVLRGGLPLGEESERKVAGQINSAAEVGGVDPSAALELTKRMLDAGLSLQQALQYLPAVTQFSYGHGVPLGATVDLVRNLNNQGVGNSAEMERALGVLAWSARQQNVSVEWLTRQMSTAAPDDARWAGLLRQPDGMQEEPLQVLQRAVEARRNTPQGRREALEIAIGNLLKENGSVFLQVADGALPTVTKAARLAEDVTYLGGVKLAMSTLQFGLAQEQLAEFASRIGYESVADRIRAVDLGPFSSVGEMSAGATQQRDAKDQHSAASTDWPGISLSDLGKSIKKFWMNWSISPVISPPSRSPGWLTPESGRDVRGPGGLPGGKSQEAGQDVPVVGVVAGSVVGALAMPVFGSILGGLLGGLYERSLEGPQAPPPEDPGSGLSHGQIPQATNAPSVVPAGPSESWAFSPNINISVAGNIVNPQQLLDELMPVMHRLISDAQQERQRNALFDTVVV